MDFLIVPRNEKIPTTGRNTAYLKIDHWNDFSYVTMFYLSLYDEEGQFLNIGNVKIGFAGQDTDRPTYKELKNKFTILPNDFFSLGMEDDYYRNIANLPKKFRNELLSSINDIVSNPSLIEFVQNENVFRTSLLRDVSLSVIKGQYTRILSGMPPLTDFVFSYRRPADNTTAGIDVKFIVQAGSKPSTNIHAIIGRNGVGKTTLLNGMIEAITKTNAAGQFFATGGWKEHPISQDYFSSLVSVSFSAFDPFTPPNEQPDPTKGACYFYVGLKKVGNQQNHSLKNLPDLHLEFIESLKSCISQTAKKLRWKKSIQTLESDENFAEMELASLADLSGTTLKSEALSRIQKMSSGHAVVLLTITKLVARVEEKTLVLIDEPESHLHPPLLSAFIRSLSELLHDRNGVALIATHSPVVLQEIPSTCVWKIDRSHTEMVFERLDLETFGENVGTLTREVFGLEVVKSGFHRLLIESVESGESYDDLLMLYNKKLGFEAKAILKALTINRDKEGQS